MAGKTNASQWLTLGWHRNTEMDHTVKFVFFQECSLETFAVSTTELPGM